MSQRRAVFNAFVGYLAFVIYGSLIPFDLRDLSFEQAVQNFANIRYLDLGIGSRADWIANIVLYIPLSFLGCMLLLGMRKVSAVRQFSLLIISLFGISVAFSLEFAQLFFAPRTVSINDLIAEILGTFGGVGLWFFGRRQLCQLWDSFHEGGQQSILSVMYGYSLVYFVQALFPFDLIVSFEEIGWKAAGDSFGWLIAGECNVGLRCIARLLGDGLAIAPLGILIALAFSNISLRRTFVAGLVIGLFIEFLQFFVASGVSHGFSVLMRGVWLAFGVWLGQWLRMTGPEAIARIVWRLTLFLFLPYLVVVAVLAGWFSASWTPLRSFIEQLGNVKIIPFYYHYYTSEPVAMASLLVNLLMYAPLGLAVWAMQATHGAAENRRLIAPVISGACLALVIELGKALVPSKHPDMTNLLIAAISSFLVYQFASWIENILNGQRFALVFDSPRNGSQ